MANKDLFKQAIAEAKSVREAAIANAKEALEETLTPHLKDMLAAKLQEMEDSQNEEVVNESEEVEETAEETVNEEKVEESTDEEVNEEETVEEATEEVDEAHGACPKCGKTHEGSCGTHEEVSEEGLTEIEPVEAADEDEAEDDSEESEDEAEHDEMPDGDEDISNLSVDQFKDMIRDIIAQEVGGDAAADDMDAGDIEGMGDEDDMEADMEEPEMAGDEEEIDLDELLAELEATEEVTEGEDKDDKKMEEKAVEEVSTSKSTEVQDTANAEAQGTNVNRVVKEDATEDKTELEQALETIETLKSDLNEVNILNSKLLYVNKIFKSNNLSESQKVNIIAAFDKAETVKEVKLVFETVSDNIIDVKKENVSEAKIKGMASKATGTTASKPQGEIVLSEAAQRMQKLAGIIK
jgi:hypothetical protein